MSTNRENISLSRDKEYLSPRHDHLANNHNIVRKQESSIKAQNTDDAKSPKANSRSAPVNANGARCPAKKDAFTSMGMSMVRGPITRMPCEPGTGVSLEGIVWQETDGGVLVVNVTWREKSFVGTLLDCTKHDWAPPRFSDSPTDDIDGNGLKSFRSKRGRSAAADSESEARVQSKLRNGKGRRATSAGHFTIPCSPGKSGESGKRRADGSPVQAKRNRSRADGDSTPASPVLIECPEPNCSKKYKHINGLKYHQTHAHGELRQSRKEERSETSHKRFLERGSSRDSTESQSALASAATLRGTSVSPSNSLTSGKALSSSERSLNDIRNDLRENVASSGYSDISDDDDSSEEKRTDTDTNGEDSLHKAPTTGSRTLTLKLSNLAPQAAYFSGEDSPISKSADKDSFKNFLYKSNFAPTNALSNLLQTSSLQYLNKEGTTDGLARGDLKVERKSDVEPKLSVHKTKPS